MVTCTDYVGVYWVVLRDTFSLWGFFFFGSFYWREEGFSGYPSKESKHGFWGDLEERESGEGMCGGDLWPWGGSRGVWGQW